PAARGPARLPGNRDPLRPRPPRPWRAEVVQEEALRLHEILTDRGWRAAVVDLVRALRIHRTMTREKMGDVGCCPRARRRGSGAQVLARHEWSEVRVPRGFRGPLSQRGTTWRATLQATSAPHAGIPEAHR